MKEITYTQVGDYLLPDLTLPEQDDSFLGRYGTLHRNYLKEYKKSIYTALMISGKINAHLLEVEATALEQLDLLIKQIAAAQGITEGMKAQDQMKWVGAMNAIKNQAEEIVLNELIYT